MSADSTQYFMVLAWHAVARIEGENVLHIWSGSVAGDFVGRICC
jgi:hypothetical protein